MFDGMAEQFQEFTIRNNTSSLPLSDPIHHHLPFPLHASSPNFTPFDLYNNPSSHHQFQLVQPPPNNHNTNSDNLLHPLPLLHHEDHKGVAMNNNLEMEMEMEMDPWSNEEVLALLRIRSAMESWFPDLTWEHVSRKMREVGYKRSAEKCKDKFEEESRYLSNNYGSNSNSNSNKGGFLSDLEGLYNNNLSPTQVESSEKALSEGAQENKKDAATRTKQKEMMRRKRKKRKRVDGRLEMFKGFCESIVHKMMEQQEEMQNKLISDMVKRDQEKLAREEAWKKQEMERMKVELEIMAKEQAVAGHRHSNIIHFLNKFSPQFQNPNSHPPSSPLNKNPSFSPPQVVAAAAAAVTTTTTTTTTTSSSAGNNNSCSSSSPLNNNSNNPTMVARKKDDIGRRWPKDEVLALINLRCSSTHNHNNNNNTNTQDDNNNNNNNKAPLWERISQGMMELGYKRSAKRCKEKWENINKYFRKTKDVNKKRSLDSRTCPYFHHLTNLYSQGKLLLLQQQQPQPHHINEDNIEDQTNTQLPHHPADDSSQLGPLSAAAHDHDGGQKTLFQVPSLDFDHF